MADLNHHFSKCLVLALAMTVLTFGCHGDSDTGTHEAQRDLNTQDTTNGRESGAIVTKPKRVTGIGGIFFKAEDPEQMRAWYEKHLGLVTNEYGSVFEFRSTDEPHGKGYLQWSPFSHGC